MTAQFHEDQEVEVWCFPDGEWEQAKIVLMVQPDEFGEDVYRVQFPGGTLAVFFASHIREVSP